MKAIISIVIAIVMNVGYTSAQENFGFYGKKNYLEVVSSSFVPLFYGRRSGEHYRVSDDGASLQRKWVFFHTGLRASLGRNFTARFGMGAEVGFDQFLLKGQFLRYAIPYQAGQLIDIKHESVGVKSFLIMPKFEFCGKRTLLPNGLHHQIGLGITINQPIVADYRTIGLYDDGTSNQEDDWESTELNFQDYNDLDMSFIAYHFMYSVRFRSALGKSLMLTYGLRFSFDFVISDKYKDDFQEQLRRETVNYLGSNFVSLDLGLTLPF